MEDGARASSAESPTLDFKTDGRSPGDTAENLAEAAACFANAAGGCIVVGVADRKAGRDAFVGTQLDPNRLQRRIYEVTSPPLIVTVEEHNWAEQRLLVITAPRSPDVHQVKGKATERVGTACEPMSAVRIAAVVAERRGDDWSAADSGVPRSAVVAGTLTEARRLLAEAPDAERRRWADSSDRDMLRRLGLLATAGTLTNAGALLLVANEASPLISYVHRRSRSGELSTNQQLSAPGLTALLRTFELIENRVDRTPVNLPNGQQLFIADLPDLAVREAVVNAFMHRDYQSTGMVQIEHSSTRLAVTSPGAFVLGVTPENILTVSSRPRNPALAGVIRQLGLAETAGVGVDRMYAEMVKVGHQPPTFTGDQFRVAVTLHGGAPNTAVTRFATTLPEDRRSDPDTLLVMLALLGKRNVTASELAPTLQKDDDEVEAILLQLATPAVGFIERTRESANARAGIYRLRDQAVAALGPAVTYRRRVSDDTDRKVIEIVREAGQVNGRIVRTLVDVDTPTASRILADLVDRQILVKTSEAQRGPSVTYGPGPQFPSSRPRKRSAKKQESRND
ncbi:ATP-binding protein [Blastococcus sp. TBT05-19]|uniref:ATP-binding protein n=1 Tax=Blastococcus sp. TBT05-19 TaxID=2250581 RepID=UPI0011BF7FB9|nr:ATP-binding protein [Blastococcus sp. TBT05-19]